MMSGMYFPALALTSLSDNLIQYKHLFLQDKNNDGYFDQPDFEVLTSVKHVSQEQTKLCHCVVFRFFTEKITNDYQSMTRMCLHCQCQSLFQQCLLTYILSIFKEKVNRLAI